MGDIGKVMKECYRILKPRGALIVNSAGPEQVTDTMWFLYLIPAACERLKVASRLGYDINLVCFMLLTELVDMWPHH